MPVDCQDAVIGLNTALLCRTTFDNRTDDRRKVHLTQSHENGSKHQNGKQIVCRRTGHRNQNFLKRRQELKDMFFFFVTQVLEFFRFGSGSGIFVTKKFAVTAERNRRNFPMRSFSVRTSPQFLAETDGKLVNLNAEQPCYPEMSEFVNKNQNPQKDQKRQHIICHINQPLHYKNLLNMKNNNCQKQSKRRSKNQPVNPVKNTAVPRDKIAGIFQPKASLDMGFD